MPQLDLINFPHIILITFVSFAFFHIILMHFYLKPYLELKSKRSQITSRIKSEINSFLKNIEIIEDEIQSLVDEINKACSDGDVLSKALILEHRNKKDKELKEMLNKIRSEAFLFLEEQRKIILESFKDEIPVLLNLLFKKFDYRFNSNDVLDSFSKIEKRIFI